MSTYLPFHTKCNAIMLVSTWHSLIDFRLLVRRAASTVLAIHLGHKNLKTYLLKEKKVCCWSGEKAKNEARTCRTCYAQQNVFAAAFFFASSPLLGFRTHRERDEADDDSVGYPIFWNTARINYTAVPAPEHAGLHHS